MKTVILAAGKGTRLKSLTEQIPKPMLPVGGKPVIGHLLEQLAGSGVREVFINLHHRSEVLKSYCGDGSMWGLRIGYAFEPELLGTAGAVKNFGEYLTEAPFFVVYGDNYFECDFSGLWKFHGEREAMATIGLFEKDDVSGSGVVEVDERGYVSRFVEKPSSDMVFSNLINGGLYVLSPEILSFIPEGEFCDFGYDVFPAVLAEGHPICGHIIKGGVWGIDTLERYRDLQDRVGGQGS